MRDAVSRSSRKIRHVTSYRSRSSLFRRLTSAVSIPPIQSASVMNISFFFIFLPQRLRPQCFLSCLYAAVRLRKGKISVEMFILQRSKPHFCGSTVSNARCSRSANRS